MSVSAAIRRMLEAGLTIEQALVAAEAFEAESIPVQPVLSARQARNKRYYDSKKASKSRLDSDNQDDSDDSDGGAAPPSDKENPPNPLKKLTTTQTSSLRSDACPEAEKSAPASPTVIELPATRGELVAVSQADITDWSEAYPGIDVMQQLRSMRQWLIANERNRKTSTGMRRFVVAWLAREQDRGGGRSPHQQAPPRQTAFQERHNAAIAAFDRKLGTTRDDEFTGNTLDLGSADWRAERAPRSGH
ncbi:hypothetical protein [Rhizobium sp. AG207R]|uniref:hypothetical protein n=1 Tax=Rhizobium sp. AG207R TaxID=2802287 RepID=UPI0022AC6BC8|nr:hypothetical protein [Rhizobium sp. AG207R]MCZ3377444.1 hypothetical protein [Rhizobium sp. AG207R]